jgi:hypothetical protein
MLNAISAALFALAVIAAVPRPAAAQTTPGIESDIATFDSEYVAKDRALTPSARNKARELLEQMRKEAGTLAPATARLRFSEIVALADNAGSLVLGNPQAPPALRMPFRSAWFSDGLFIVRAHAAHANIAGAQILAIDGRSIASLTRALARYRGGLPSRRRALGVMMLEVPELLHAAGLAAVPDALTLRLRMRDGAVVDRLVRVEPALPITFWPDRWAPEGMPGNPGLWVHAADAATLPLYLKQSGRPHRAEYIDDLDAIYLQIKWTPEARQQPVPPLAAALSGLWARDPARLVVDLRFDHGGSSPEIVALLQEQTRLAVARKIDIWLLLGPQTHESGIVAAASVKQTGGRAVTIVGEPVGDRLQFWASAGRTCLAYAQACVVHAARRFDVRDGCAQAECEPGFSGFQVASLDPDLRIPTNGRDFLVNRDPLMSKVARRASKGQRSAPKRLR